MESLTLELSRPLKKTWTREVQERSSLRSDIYYHFIDAVSGVGEGNGLFESHIKKELERLTYKFDLKYWPSISEFITAVGADAGKAVTVVSDSTAVAATEGCCPGLADFLKTFIANLAVNRVRRHGWIPNNFSLSDSEMASLVNCALGWKSMS